VSSAASRISRATRRSLLLLLSCAAFFSMAAAPVQAQPAKRKVLEVIYLMQAMHSQALAVHSYAQLYEACTQKTAPPELAVAPNDPEQAWRALGLLAVEWHQLPEAEVNELALQCKRRIMKLMGPHGRYYTAAESKEWGIGGNFHPGLLLTLINGQVVVRDTLAGSPAAAAGVQAGEVLISVDGRPVAGLDLDALFGLLRRPAASPSQLVTQRPGEPPQTRTVARAQASFEKTVVAGPAPGHLYIRVAGFFEGTPARLAESLRAQPPDGSGVRVLDLRGNPGGVLNDVQAVLAVLGRHGNAGTWYPLQYRPGSTEAKPFSATESANRIKGTAATGIVELREWLVLVDSDTASGATWLAGVLRELNGAVLVGQPPDTSNFGVDVLQNVEEAGGIAGISYEVSQLGLPSGKVLTADNTRPDVVLPRALADIRPLPRSVADWLQDPLYMQIRDRLRPSVSGR
jgi:C-terminal processing protease CtpA/Prc